MNAFVIIHFGNIPKYLELEMYFLIMLKKYTRNDILYMYSINDTPISFLKIIEDLKVKTIPYDDKDITYGIKDFQSVYISFNTLRTCNFIFAFTLTQYEKICIVESDMVIMSNIDDIFYLNDPAILYYNPDIYKHNINYLIDIHKKDSLKLCNEKSQFNGGVLLFQPSLEIFHNFKKNIKFIIENNCKYPNETLFIYTLDKIYNLPVKYNFSHYHIYKEYLYGKILVYHFNNTIYKPVDIIKDNYINKENKKKKKIILFFKNKVYDENYKNINHILDKLKID